MCQVLIHVCSQNMWTFLLTLANRYSNSVISLLKVNPSEILIFTGLIK